MLRDVFYYGSKPNVHPREQFAENLEDARRKATTRDFWVINEFCDYRNFDWDFDFEFLPDEDVWAEDHNNVWPSQHQKDSGTWLCPKEHSDLIIYRGDVDPVIRKNEKQSENWVELDLIDHSKFDFSWHPDPTDPPFIYKWGCKFFPAELKHVLEYRVPGATQEKYMTTTVELLPETEFWVEHQAIDKHKFDMSWRPNPLDPPFIYVWGNKYIDGKLKPTLEYHAPGAIDKKYMPEKLAVLPEWDRWVFVEQVDKNSFDFSWRPAPREPDLIYVFGNEQHEGNIMPTVEYHMPNATERKYINDADKKVRLLPNPSLFEHLEDSYGVDYSWRPDPTSPPYIYAWGNQWNAPEDKISVQYVVEGATEYKYLSDHAIRKPCMDNWIVPDNVDVTDFDFSWEPNPHSPPYIYEFATQWQKTGGPQYVVPGATEKQYVDFQKVKRLPSVEGWKIPSNIDSSGFDFSWHPDDTSPPYVYIFATQWAFSGGPVYAVPGATEIKYVDDQTAIAITDMTNWVYDEYEIDIASFDFSWHPYVEDQPYIYQFGTQWQKTGGPRYITPGADSSSPVKYIDTRILKATRLPNENDYCWVEHYPIKNFDYSWHPDETEEPYIYVFGNNLYPAEEMPTIEYRVPNATQVKFVNDTVAELDIDMTNWVITQPINEERFDFSWKPNPNDPPYIYRWGNKYISNKYKATVEYVVPGATDIKYMTDDVEVLPEMDRWEIPDDVDTTDFDFTWRPDPLEPDLIWEFGTQWQKTGGPRYVMPGATETKYLDFQKVKKLPSSQHWKHDYSIDKSSFDWSWHPDATDPPYIYAWGNQWVKAEDKPSVEYHVPGATEYRYMEEIVTRTRCLDHWQIPDDVDVTGFDFSWEPSPAEQPYIYQFGTQWQKTGGPRYVVSGATEVKYIDFQAVKKLPNIDAFIIVNDAVISDFDYSWHPDETEEPYIYSFGNNLYAAEEMSTVEYRVPGATTVKYVHDIVATLAVDMRYWDIPNGLDTAGFDFSWRPKPNDLPYVYEFATQWQKTGGPRYVVEGATEVKYLDFQKVTALSNKSVWKIPNNINVSEFDFSWHPDATDPPYIYQFGTQWALSGGPRYVVEGATEIKYMDDLVAIALPDKTNWEYDEKLIDVNSFDFSWHPYVEDQPYIYQFGTQWQKTGGPRYITPGASDSSPVKYVDTRILKATRLSNPDAHWNVCCDYTIEKFDFSWHPDETEEPYVYQFGSALYPVEEMPVIEYRVSGANEIKYVHNNKATLGATRTNWVITQPVDETSFDFSWVPNPTSPPYIYRWGNKYISNKYKATVEYVVPGATDIKYMTDDVEVLPEMDRWEIPSDVNTEGFDFTWRPDPLEPDLIWEFGTQWQKTGGPRYVMPGAMEVKYIESQKVTKLPRLSGWEIPECVDTSSFDFSWHPDATDPPYIYQFGTQWALSGGPRYVMPGATEVKYMDELTAKATANKTNWDFDESLFDVDSFDFSWHPYVEDQPYIYQFGTQWQKTGGPRYITPGATANSPVKYIDTRIIKAIRLPRITSHWQTLEYKIENFDYSWHPDETEEPYIYVFGNNLYPAEECATVTYTVEGATQVKYVHDIVATLAPNKTNWEIPDTVDISKFDLSWVPHPKDPPYIYVFGNQWYSAEKMPTVKYYATEDATEFKYVSTISATLKPDMTNWIISDDLVIKDFDFSWIPDPYDPPLNYVFGNNLYPAEEMATVTYKVEGATETKFVTDIVAKLGFNMKNWEIPAGINVSRFDFSWVPHPAAPPYIYQFGNKLDNNDGPRYITPGNTGEIVYLPRLEVPDGEETNQIVVNRYVVETTLEDLINEHPDEVFWATNKNVDYVDFDFDWRPGTVEVAWESDYVHVFGSPETEIAQTYFVNAKSYLKGKRDLKYVEPDKKADLPTQFKKIHGWLDQENNEIDRIVTALYADMLPQYSIKTTLEDLINEHPNEAFWAVRDSINYNNFDFDWRPEIEKAIYIQVFGSPDSEITQTYLVSADIYNLGYTNFNFIEAEKRADAEYLTSLFKPNDMFFVDRGNQEAKERFELLKQRYPNIQKTRYLNSWVDTINRCINRSTTELLWVLNSELDYTNFNFNYYPNPWQMKMVQVFGTQWSHWGTTFMVNRETFPEDTKYIKIIEHLSMLNFVKDHRAVANECVYDIFVIDHGNDETSKVVEVLQQKAPTKNVNVIKYDESYLNTIRALVNRLPEKKEHYLWLCSSVCDYSKFDFSYICDPFARDNLHVFPSGRQKFGDTFLVDVNKTKEIIGDLDSLENYHKVNYNGTVKAERLPVPSIVTSSDTLVDAVKNSMTRSFPYAVIMTEDNVDLPETDYEPMNLWAPETKNIIITTTGATRIIAPYEAREKISRELYDYPYIKRAPKLTKSNPMDIVFLSNGEVCADAHYEHLLNVTKGLPNRVVRVDGINGRAAAYHAAAEASETPWMFTVFAKLKVSPKFDWNWQPDRMQVPKHYIFHAKNPVNGLVYGHQAMIAYNKKLTLANEGRGLDFTLDDEHEIVPLISGVAHYNTDPFSTWRTAFREVLKLKADNSEESRVRLDTWLNKAEGEFSQFSIKGAVDADEYYDEVAGDFDKLKLSYEWSWLQDRFDKM